MISASLLDQLREKDKKLWDTWTTGLIGIDGLGLASPYSSLAEAWLQACLQAAIRARKWLATVHAKSDESNHRCLARLDSEDDEIETVVEYGSTEADALCLAYLEAIEAVKG